MLTTPYETLPGLDGRAVSYTGGGTPSVHRYPSPNLSPELREIELVQISEASRKERPQVLIPSLGEGTRRQKPPFASLISTLLKAGSVRVIVVIYIIVAYPFGNRYLQGASYGHKSYPSAYITWICLGDRFQGKH